MTPRAHRTAATRKRPATGDARKTHHPLKIDRLPMDVQQAICQLYNAGCTWAEIEQLSKLTKKDGGFVDWDALLAEVLELFPGRYIPHSNLHRYYDLRIQQVKQNVLERSEQARVVAEAFAGSVIEGGESAVLFAARDTIMTVLAEDNSSGGRAKAAKALTSLAEVMQSVRRNDIKERQVALAERVMQMKLDAIKQKAGEILKTADGEPVEGAVQLTRDEVLQKVREIYGVA